ncbi:hypothetical protein H6P81_013889 [Aristolochia fimbriata]|uniref:Uncharacterized protein n=1 Tax=Aristolochia fimbriata TaxID=158543 RepID=A0AAV7EIT2_ARIFI|nr:hypothetical protein H6P81_013889 [Aristolochia fimbriata]
MICPAPAAVTSKPGLEQSAAPWPWGRQCLRWITPPPMLPPNANPFQISDFLSLFCSSLHTSDASLKEARMGVAVEPLPSPPATSSPKLLGRIKRPRRFRGPVQTHWKMSRLIKCYARIETAIHFRPKWAARQSCGESALWSYEERARRIELRRKPWEAEKGVAIPEELKVGFSLFDGARRWYIDVESLKGELAVKITSKSSTQRSYVRNPLCEVESVRSNFSQLTKLSTLGNTKLSHNKRIVVGIFEEDGKPLWRFVEKRGTTTVGTVDIPKFASAGKGWKWIDESLSEIHGRTFESDATTVPQQKKRASSHTQTNMYTYREALLTDKQRTATKEPLISVGLIQGRPTIFRAIGSLAGDVTEIDIDAMQGVGLDCARVKIQAFPTFAGRMSVTLKVGEFQYMALLEDEHKQREDPRVEGKEKGRSKVKEKK